MSAVEQYARAHLVTDSSEGHRAVPVILHYDAETDPHAVRIGLPGAPHRVFDRQLLERGLRAPVTSGNVHVWPCGRVQTVVEFHEPEGVTVVQFDASALVRFLRRTHTTATPITH